MCPPAERDNTSFRGLDQPNRNEGEVEMYIMNTARAARVTALALSALVLATSTAGAASSVGVPPERSATVTTPYSLPSGAPIKGTQLGGGSVLIESVDASGARVSTVIPPDGPIVVKQGFWGKVWDWVKKAYKWVKKHVVIK